MHVLPSGETFSVENDHAGVEVWRVAALSSAVVRLESTGSFERLAVATLAGACLAIVVVNPAHG